MMHVAAPVSFLKEQISQASSLAAGAGGGMAGAGRLELGAGAEDLDLG